MRRAFRVIAILAAIALAVSAASFGFKAAAWRKQFHRWMVEEHLNIPIRLDVPGHFEGSFDNTCTCSHSHVLEVEFDNLQFTSASRCAALDALRGTVEFVPGVDQPESLQSDIGIGVMTNDYLDTHSLQIARRPLGRTATYRVIVDITRGNPALADSSATLVLRNELCGMEMMPAFVMTVVAVASGAGSLLSFGIAMALRPRQMGPDSAAAAVSS